MGSGEWSELKREITKARYQGEVRSKYEEAVNGQTDANLEEEWNTIKSALVEGMEEIIPVKTRQAMQPWMTEEILVMMDERQKLRKHGDRYLELDREIKRKCNARKEEWLNQRCEEVEQLEHTNTRVMHEKISEVTGSRRPTRSSVIKDKEGNVLMDSPGILKRWEEYIKELYGDGSRGERLRWDVEMSGPPILRSERMELW